MTALIVSLCQTVHQQQEMQAIKNELQEQIQAMKNELHQEQKALGGQQHELPRYLEVTGLVGDGITDDTKAIKKALRKASKGRANAKVVLPKGTFLITKPLIIKGGVTLMGQGYGSSPLALQFNAGGTVLAYCGTDYAVKITGHAASLESLAVTDFSGKFYLLSLCYTGACCLLSAFCKRVNTIFSNTKLFTIICFCIQSRQIVQM